MRVVLTIFAGRKGFLEIQFRYLDKLLASGQLSEVHLWDYCRDPADREYLESFTSKRLNYKVVVPQQRLAEDGTWHWADYYRHFIESDQYDDDTIIVKGDDDIVYIDTEEFGNFLGQVTYDNLFFPNIINNDVCALLQQRAGLFGDNPPVDVDTIPPEAFDLGYMDPLNGWAPDRCWAAITAKARRLHETFLDDRHAFKLSGNNIKWGSRISINFYAGRYKSLKKYYEQFMEYDGAKNDEGFLSAARCLLNNQENVIVPFFNVSHFAFGGQRDGTLGDLLQRYDVLSRK